MDLTESIAVVIPGVLARRMADRLVVVAPLIQTAVDVVLIGENDAPLGYHPLDQGTDRRLFDVLQHPDHDLAGPLEYPEDRRLLLGQRPPATFPFQASSPPGSSFFFNGPRKS